MTSQIEAADKTLPLDEPSHLKEYLDYYKTLSNPGYGVLVTGDWGSGKTHQVKEILNPNEMHYISLFGIQTTEEIYSSVFAKMYPGRSAAKDIANASNGSGAGPVNLGGLLSGVANAIIRESVNNDKIIVFDDLERSSVNTNDLLGAFNKYVEHHSCRVIVLAHDKKIAEEFKGIKEKVFGQTIAVIPQTSKAFDAFVGALKDHPDSTQIIGLKSEILDTFEQSETHSLRILKHSLEDLVRLFSALSPVHKANKDALLELTSLFFALSLEVRSGRIDELGLKDRSDKIIRFQMAASKKDPKTTTPKIYESYIRYKNIDIRSRILNDEVLTSILIKGSYSTANIQKSLNESFYFADPADLPAWQVFMNFDEVDDSVSHDAAEKLKHQFDNGQIIESGEILHLFSLRLLMSDMGIIPTNLEETEAACIKYMEDLLALDKMEPFTGYDLYWEHSLSTGHASYVFWIEDSYKNHFKRLKDYLKEAQGRATKNRYPEFKKTLLNLITTDGKKFAEMISHTNGGQNRFASIDILSSIDPSDFVQEWMGSKAINWRHIARGLEQRYSSGQLSSTLKEEKNWLKNVINLIDQEKRKSKGIRRKRIERILPLSLRNMIN